MRRSGGANAPSRVTCGARQSASASLGVKDLVGGSLPFAVPRYPGLGKDQIELPSTNPLVAEGVRWHSGRPSHPVQSQPSTAPSSRLRCPSPRARSAPTFPAKMLDQRPVAGGCCTSPASAHQTSPVTVVKDYHDRFAADFERPCQPIKMLGPFGVDTNAGGKLHQAIASANSGLVVCGRVLSANCAYGLSLG